MKVITAPEKYTRQKGDILVFLGGGITNCPEWQKEVISILQDELPDNVVLFNPRRDDFDVTDPTASDKQVEWEYKWLNKCNIFTMWFAGTDDKNQSPQPICFYELGKYKQKFIDLFTEEGEVYFDDDFDDTIENHVCVSVDSRFIRKFDVIKQCELDGIKVDSCTVKDHAMKIKKAVENISEVFRLQDEEFGDFIEDEEY